MSTHLCPRIGRRSSLESLRVLRVISQVALASDRADQTRVPLNVSAALMALTLPHTPRSRDVIPRHTMKLTLKLTLKLTFKLTLKLMRKPTQG